MPGLNPAKEFELSPKFWALLRLSIYPFRLPAFSQKRKNTVCFTMNRLNIVVKFFRENACKIQHCILGLSPHSINHIPFRKTSISWIRTCWHLSKLLPVIIAAFHLIIGNCEQQVFQVLSIHSIHPGNNLRLQFFYGNWICYPFKTQIKKWKK